MAIDPNSDRPIYKQIADELRARIRSGELAAGARLASENELMATYDVARPTVRRSLALLEQEGLTESQRGRGTFVRSPAPVVTMRSTRFRAADRAAGRGALAAEAAALGLTCEAESMSPITIEDVSDEIASTIGERRAAVRRRRMWVGGAATQLADSYIPESVDQAIGYSAGADTTAMGGIYGLLEQQGYRLTRFREQLHARLATPEEATALHLSPGSPVVHLVRHALAGDQVVEYFDSIADAGAHRYAYEFDAT